MKVLSVVGFSGAGKTYLIERLVPLLRRRGLRVLVVKHALKFDVDREGKDSYRIYGSGADVLVVSDAEIFYRARGSLSLDEICEIFNFYDLIITEGFRRECRDRIVVLRSKDEIDEFRCGNIIAVVCEEEVEGFKTFRRDQIPELVDLIMSWLESGQLINNK